MRSPILGWLVVVALSSASAAATQERPTIRVSFGVAEQTYIDEYTDAELSSIRQAVTARIVQMLEKEISFVSFDPTSAGDYHLEFTLARKDPSATGADEVGVHGRLGGPGVPTNRLYWFRFREIDQFNARKGEPAELVRELEAKIDSASPGPVARELLGLVPIARSAAVWSDPLGWVLPFKHEDLCLDGGSTLSVRSRVPSGGGPVRAEFRGDASGEFDPRPLPDALRDRRHHILSLVFPEQPHLDALRSAAGGAGVEVEAIFVREYLRNDLLCVPSVPPEDAFPGSGGET